VPAGDEQVGEAGQQHLRVAYVLEDVAGYDHVEGPAEILGDPPFQVGDHQVVQVALHAPARRRCPHP